MTQKASLFVRQCVKSNLPSGKTSNKNNMKNIMTIIVVALVTMFFQPQKTYAQEGSFVEEAWQMEAFRIVGEFIGDTNYLYQNDPVLEVVSNEFEWFEYRFSTINIYEFEEWMGQNYPGDFIPAVAALSGNSVFQNWSELIGMEEFEQFDWEDWELRWIFELFLSGLNGPNDDPEGEPDDTDGGMVEGPPWEWVEGFRDKSKNRALIRSGTGATIEGAAKFTRLDSRDSHLWLLDENGNGVNSDDDIVIDTIYSVPNTVVIASGGASTLAKTHMLLWYTKLADAAMENGFAVELFRIEDGDNVAKYYNRATMEDDVWGLMMFGHGTVKYNLGWFWVDDTYEMNGAFQWDDENEDTAKTPVNFNPVIVDPGNGEQGLARYGFLLSYFCYADYQPWSSLVSENGTYYGSDGMLSSASGPRGIGWWGTWKGLFDKAAKPLD